MPAYIREKLVEIEEYVKNLSGKRDSLKQEMQGILDCVSKIESEVKRLSKNHEALYKIQTLIDKGGEPAFLVERIKKILEDLKKL